MSVDEALTLAILKQLDLNAEATYTPQEISQRLGLRSRRSVYAACQSGSLEATRDGWGYQIIGASVARWIAARSTRFMPHGFANRSAETR